MEFENFTVKAKSAGSLTCPTSGLSTFFTQIFISDWVIIWIIVIEGMTTHRKNKVLRAPLSSVEYIVAHLYARLPVFHPPNYDFCEKRLFD